MRDPSVYLFVNEGDETGNLIFGLCFPMASLDVDGPHLETGESENGGEQAGHREGMRATSWAPHAIVGQDSWVGWLGTTSATLCCFGNFMKKEGEKRNSWGGIAREYCSPGTWRLTSWAAEGAGWWDGWGEKWNGGREEEIEAGEVALAAA